MLKYFKQIGIVLMIMLIAILINATSTYAIQPASDQRYEGIDVSNWQGYIDYSQVAADGIQIVYIKASQGTNYKDPYFDINYENAKANGLKVGFYHYLTATSTEGAVQEAQFFASVISGKVPDCKLVLDYETFGGVGREGINEIARTFLENVRRLTNKPVIVYSDLFNAQDTFNASIADNYELWLAYYGNYESLYDVQTQWNQWIGLQYTDMGIISGIEGYTDRNIFTQEILIGETSEIPNVDNPTGNEYNTRTLTYTVQPGNTLGEIAQRYGTTYQELAKINGIANPNLIFPGQVLKIITNTNMPGQETREAGSIIYTVQRGNTLSQIAQVYGTTVQEIATTNRISNVNLIFPGEQLKITNSTRQPAREINQAVYIVKSGDTLSGIARRFGVTVNDLVTRNGINNPDLIFPGQRLFV